MAITPPLAATCVNAGTSVRVHERTRARAYACTSVRVHERTHSLHASVCTLCAADPALSRASARAAVDFPGPPAQALVRAGPWCGPGPGEGLALMRVHAGGGRGVAGRRWGRGVAGTVFGHSPRDGTGRPKQPAGLSKTVRHEML
jgi:hypothetical protein